MIKITKLEAEHVLYTFEEIKRFLNDTGYTHEELMDLLDTSDEIIRACVCNSVTEGVDEPIDNFIDGTVCVEDE